MNPFAHQLLVDRINDALPQTQCTRCGYDDCAAYAQAVASGQAAINQCPPGGAQGIERLSRITGLPVQPLNPSHGLEGPRAVALIDEAWCIGCTLCIKACPTDAIFGSNKRMHTVIEPWCTGCALCVPVCPVDCISLENVSGEHTGWNAWSAQDAETARIRYAFHSKKANPDFGKQDKTLKKPLQQPANGPASPEADAVTPLPAAASTADPAAAVTAVAERKRAMIEAALARSRAQRATGA